MVEKVLPDLPKINLTFPSSPLIEGAFAYSQAYLPETAWAHTVRSAYFAVIISKKVPTFANVDIISVIVSCILHDLGWTTVEGVGSAELRFEVDGAELARDWLREQSAHNGDEDGTWDKHRQQLVWDAIALHTTPEIAHYKEPEVALTQLGIATDFSADRQLGGVVTREEFREVVRVFPRADFNPGGVKRILCGLCARKPNTTFHNFVAEFGARFGYDGEGQGKEDYQQKLKQASTADALISNLEYVESILK
jgi:hypothetical protein